MLKYDEYERVDDESEFLEKVSVNLYLMVYGFLPDQIDYYYLSDDKPNSAVGPSQSRTWQSSGSTT